MVFKYNTTRAELDSAAGQSKYGEWFNSEENACRVCGFSSSSSSAASSYVAANSFCRFDCSGSYRGSAFLDGCGVCSGGATNHTPESDRDCRGQCFGPFRVLAENQLDQFAADPELLSAAQATLGQCVCPPSLAATGDVSCSFYETLEGPVQASEVMYVLPYEAFLVALAGATAVAGVIVHLALYVKRHRQIGVVLAALDAGPVIVVAAAQGGAGGAPPPIEIPAAAQQPARADPLLGVIGGLERSSAPPEQPAASAPSAPPAPAPAQQTRSERRRAERAAAASPGMSAAAQAALGRGSLSASDNTASNVVRPPASNYQPGR